MDRPCLELRSVSKRYPDGTQAVREVSIRVECGTITALLGPNGSGKSTLLAMAAGVTRPSSGEILVLGASVWGPEGRRARRLIGYMPQVDPLHPLLTGWENLSFHASMHGVRLDESLVYEAAETLGLGREALKRRVRSYSGGMKRKLSLIAALLHEPKVLLLDEPDSGLDPGSRQGLIQLLRSVADGGSAVVYSTHLGQSASHADYVVFMNRGRVVDEGAPSELVKRYAPWRLVELEVADTDGLLLELKSFKDIDVVHLGSNIVRIAIHGDDEVLAAVIRSAARYGLRRLSAREPGVEDAFLTATGQPLRAEEAG